MKSNNPTFKLVSAIVDFEKEIELLKKHNKDLKKVMRETQQLLSGSSSIIDTVWCNSIPNTTLYELIEITIDETN